MRWMYGYTVLLIKNSNFDSLLMGMHNDAGILNSNRELSYQTKYPFNIIQ